MGENYVFNNREVNQATRDNHRREVLWQITVPFVLAVLIFLAFVVWVGIAGARGSGQISTWADVSLIWLILPTMALALIALIALSGLLYGIIKLIGMLPVYSLKLQRTLWKTQTILRSGSDTAVEPVLKIESVRAGARTLLGK